MSDLKMMKDTWGEPPLPSPDAYRAARAALMREVAGAGAPRAVRRQPRFRFVRPGWLVVGATTAAALAAALVLTVIPGTSPQGPVGGDHSGRDLLFAAAFVAQSQPTTVGTYWHVRTVPPPGPNGTTATADWWTAHDGAGYAQTGPGVVRTTPPGSGFSVAGEHLSLDELQQLPTDAAALTTWIAGALGTLGESDVDGGTAVVLSEVLWRVPAPPAVRAAAFRALADLGNVTRLGDQAGNWVLRIEFADRPSADKFPGGVLPDGIGEWTVVIDPATSQLVSLKTYQGTDQVLLTEWTDDLPPVVESSKPSSTEPPGATVHS